jgi:hypothetical protein
MNRHAPPLKLTTIWPERQRNPTAGYGGCVKTAGYGDCANAVRWLAMVPADTGAAALPQLFRM